MQKADAFDEDVDLQGLSMSLAIPTGANCSEDAIEFENAYLTQRFGERGVGWRKEAQALMWFNGRALDQIHIVVEGLRLRIYFDVTDAVGGAR